MMSYEKLAETSSKVTYTSAGGTFVAGISLNEWAAIVGIVITIAAFCVNWYYKDRHYKLAQKVRCENEPECPLIHGKN